MLDAVTLDQLRTFIAAADEDSFSAVGRKLRRAQSVVSQTLAKLEGQFGVKLFDRTRRRPVLTHRSAQARIARSSISKGSPPKIHCHDARLSGEQPSARVAPAASLLNVYY